MIIYNKYINNEDYTWYDSSNIMFSKCYDNAQLLKTLKVVFKDGRTYLYKDVNANDYIAFKTAPSNGSALNTYIIKKNKGVRISDTDIEKLENLKENFITEEKQIDNEPLSNLNYHLDICEKTGQFNLKLNDKIIYSALEGQVSIVNLFKSMNIKYSWTTVDEINNESDENKNEIDLNNGNL